jgi:hypothetical protein
MAAEAGGCVGRSAGGCKWQLSRMGIGWPLENWAIQHERSSGMYILVIPIIHGWTLQFPMDGNIRAASLSSLHHNLHLLR